MTDIPTPPPAAPTGTGTPVDGFFERLRHSGVHRDGERRWFGGVCAGLADRAGVDPVLVRAAAIVL
ncbi:MAG: PspC domain-containing protein, partial [Dermatophilaceae bacterium]